MFREWRGDDALFFRVMRRLMLLESEDLDIPNPLNFITKYVFMVMQFLKERFDLDCVEAKYFPLYSPRSVFKTPFPVGETP